MNALTSSLVVAGIVFIGAMVGFFASRLLPETHMTRETQDVVRLGTGMLSVLASLVLGLLIATAKGASDNTVQSLRGYAADLILLDETLRDYGDSAQPPRALLRQYTARTLQDIWPPDGARAPVLASRQTTLLLERVREAIRALHPVDDGQKWLMDQALQVNVTLLRQRWLLIEQQEANIRPLVLAVLVSWITVIFASFGLNAPRNATVASAFLVCSLAIGGSIFLILEMDHPFAGLLRVSSAPLRNALDHMTVDSGATATQGGIAPAR